jgi:hypothetical protein
LRWVRAGAEVTTFPSVRKCANTVFAMMQETVITKKRRGPAPTGKGTLVGVRLQPDDLAALDDWIDGKPDPKPSRPEAIRTILAKWLKRR